MRCGFNLDLNYLSSVILKSLEDNYLM